MYHGVQFDPVPVLFFPVRLPLLLPAAVEEPHAHDLQSAVLRLGVRVYVRFRDAVFRNGILLSARYACDVRLDGRSISCILALPICFR